MQCAAQRETAPCAWSTRLFYSTGRLPYELRISTRKQLFDIHCNRCIRNCCCLVLVTLRNPAVDWHGWGGGSEIMTTTDLVWKNLKGHGTPRPRLILKGGAWDTSVMFDQYIPIAILGQYFGLAQAELLPTPALQSPWGSILLFDPLPINLDCGQLIFYR